MPKAFTIDIKDELSRTNIMNETLAYFESCQLNKDGEALCKNYKDILKECTSSQRKLLTPNFMNPSEEQYLMESPILLKRSSSDPLHSDINAGDLYFPTLFSMKVIGVPKPSEIRMKKLRPYPIVLDKTSTAAELNHETGMGKETLDSDLQNYRFGLCDNFQDQLSTSHLQVKTTIQDLFSIKKPPLLRSRSCSDPVLLSCNSQPVKIHLSSKFERSLCGTTNTLLVRSLSLPL